MILETEANGNFLHFGQYNLSATPSTGYVFVNWQGDGNDTQLLNGPSEQSNQLIVEGPITLQPVFAIREYEVLVTKSGNGTISGEGNYTFDDNGSNLISANPDAGWYFDKWADDGNISSLSSPTSATPQLTLPLSGPTKQSLSFTAEFVQSTHQLDLNVSEGNGSIALTVDGVNRSESNSSISESLLSLLEVSVEANASEGFEFRRWVGLPNSSQLYSDTESSLLSTNATISFFPSTDLNISAEFALIEYDDSQVVISESSHGSVILETEANGNFLHFGQYNLSATPSTGYVFVNWQGDGNDTQLLNGPSEQSNQLIVEGPITLQPVFAIREYEVLVTKSGNGTISGEGNYTFDDNGSNLISANPDAGWYFDKWADDGNISSLSSPTSATPQLTLPPLRTYQAKSFFYR